MGQPKKVLVAIPSVMLDQMDHITQVEARTRSDLIREAIRRYLANFAATQRITRPIVIPVQNPAPAPLNEVFDTDGGPIVRKPYGEWEE